MNFTKKIRLVICAITAMLFLGQGQLAMADRIKDLAKINGIRSNQLIGYGIVVGLDGSGDQTTQTPFTVQSVKNMLAKLGVAIPANASTR